MKTIRFTLASLAVIAAFALIVTLSKCKKDNHPIIVGTYIISGLCTYPDYTTTMVPAKGAVLQIYAGSDPNPLTTTYSDASGNYKFINLVSGPYIIKAKYNTANQNYKPINGINFVTATYSVTVSNSNLTQNIALLTEAPTGTRILTIIKADTIGHSATRAYVPMDVHSQGADWWTEYSGDAWGNIAGTTLQGGFRQAGTGFFLNSFYFDEANPQNDTIIGYVLMS